MKNFQQNLLVVFALGLCGLCVFQWRIQTDQRKEIMTLDRLVSARNLTIQSATNSVATLNQQLDQMDVRLTQIKAAAATNALLITKQRADLEQLRFKNAGLTNAIAQYKAAVTKLTHKLKAAYAGIEKQNQTLTNLVAQRDQLVQKYNASVKDRNNVVEKYNALVKRIDKERSGSGA